MAEKIRHTLAAVAVLLLVAFVSANVPEEKKSSSNAAPAAHAAHHLRVDSVTPKTSTTTAPSSTTFDPTTSVPKLVTPSVGDIVHQTKLGAQFLKTAAQLTKMLSEDDKKKMKDNSMVEATHDIVDYAKTLLATMGQGEKAAPPPSSHALSPSDIWGMRGSHSKPRPVCTVTSGYWDRECECEFIPRPKRPHRPRPDEDNDDDDDDDDEDNHHHEKPTTTQAPPPPPHRKPKPRPTRPLRPVYPWHHEHQHPRPEFFYPEHSRPEYEGPYGHYWSRPRPEHPEPEEEEEPEGTDHHHQSQQRERPDADEIADRVENLIENLSNLLDTLSYKIQSIHHHPGSYHEGLRTDQRVQLIKVPLAQVSKLKSIVKNQKVVRKVKSGGGLAMEHYLKQTVADLEAMVNYPDYMADQLGKLGAKQPLVVQMQTIINKLEPLSH